VAKENKELMFHFIIRKKSYADSSAAEWWRLNDTGCDVAARVVATDGDVTVYGGSRDRKQQSHRWVR